VPAWLEVAGDGFLVRELFDAVDGGQVAGHGELRALAAEQLLEMREAVVEHRGQMGRGAPRLAGADAVRVDDLHLAAIALQQVGGGQAGDAGADHADVGVARRLRGNSFGKGVVPDGNGLVGRAQHGTPRIGGNGIAVSMRNVRAEFRLRYRRRRRPTARC
jgi:hypothetical protein